MAESLLEVRDLQVSHSQAEVLRGVDLGLETGEIVFVLGPNGAGKSTLLRCLAGRHPVERGAVCLAGEDLLEATTRERIHKGVVLCPEGRHLFGSMTVRENLLLGAHHRLDGRTALEHDLGVLCQRIHWLEDRLSQPAGTLSGGEQQMVAVARAVMARPRLLLLDEPTIGLSPAAIADLGRWLRSQAAKTGLTILGTEQNVVFGSDVADRCVILSKGRIDAFAQDDGTGEGGLAPLAARLFGVSLPAS